MATEYPLVKICGLKTKEEAEVAINASADFLGVVFYPPSPRNLSLEQAIELKSYIRGISNVPIVAVTVNPQKALLEEIAAKLAPDWLQLHGNESPQHVEAIRTQYKNMQIIKAIAVRSDEDIKLSEAYIDKVDALLFDAKAPDDGNSLPGGNGLQFDWELLGKHDFSIPWFLSGGLNTQNVQQAVKTTGAMHIDVSSGVEAQPGVKNTELIKKFIAAAKYAQTVR